MKKKLMYVLPFMAFCVMMIIGCGNQTGKKENQQNLVDETKSTFQSAETYVGTVPCADCEGIQMILKISTDSQNFELSETYKGKGDETFVQTGKVNTERGLDDDKDATIYILNSDKPEKEQYYFVRYSNDTNNVHMLSRDKKRIVSKLNYTLSKQ